jgi:hypothetical protein
MGNFFYNLIREPLPSYNPNSKKINKCTYVIFITLGRKTSQTKLLIEDLKKRFAFSVINKKLIHVKNV